MSAVEFDHVDIVFGDRQGDALKLLDEGQGRAEILTETDSVIGVADANLKIEEGEICVLMGLSGSGKSTLLRAVNGLNDVSRGRVLVRDGGDQVDIAACDSATLRRMRMERIAMVFQQFALLPWRTVEENVGFGLELRGLTKAARKEIVDEKLAMVQLTEWRDKYGHELSGGMQQRVGLARAFATDADILLMDEPFSALDPLIRNYLQDELLELQHSLRKTIIFVSHDLDEALKIGSHIAIMEAGRIVQYGTPEDIVQNPANDYVAEFVAHMNPLTVLRAGTLMTPLADLPRTGEQVRLDDHSRHAVGLDDQDRPIEPMPEISEGDDLQQLAPGTLVAVAADMIFRQVIEIHHRTKAPVILLEDGKMVGCIDDHEIYDAILRQTKVAGGTTDAETT